MRQGRGNKRWFTGRVLCYLLIAAMVLPQLSMRAYAQDVSPEDAEGVVYVQEVDEDTSENPDGGGV